MRYSAVISALFAVSVVAVPVIKVVDVVDVVSVTITAGTPEASAVEAAEAASSASAARAEYLATHTTSTTTPPPPPPTSTSTPPPPPPSSTPAPAFLEAPQSSAPAPQSSAASAPAPSGNGAGDGSPMSGGVSVLSTANKWRSLYGLPQFSWSDEMAQNAQQVGQNGGGVNQVHTLVAGANEGQVITPGQQTATTNLEGDTPFELAWVSWLCEVPTDPQLQASGNGVDQCGLVKSVLNMEYDDTEHHAILVNPQYTQIGCAFTANPAANSQSTYQGLWVCSLDYP